MTRLTLSLFLCALAVVHRAWSEPPPVGSPDYAITHPHSAWIIKQHDRLGRWCCSEGDAALVEERQHDGGYQVRPLHPDPLRGIPEGWQTVPDDHMADLHGHPNEVGAPMAWYYHDRPQCVIPSSGT